MMIRSCLIILLALVITGCAESAKSVDTTNLSQIKDLTVKSANKKDSYDTGHIRRTAVKEAAERLGTRGALAAEAKIINHNLLEHKNELRQTFNFRQLMLGKHVLPPVLETAQQISHLSDSRTLHVADRTYKIVKQARFVTNPPNWRDYLMMHYKKPEVPNRALLPRNKKELNLWRKTIDQAWHKGLNQARNIYADNLSRLKRDYNGMQLYRELQAKNMVSKPYVAEANQGINTKDNNSQLNIGEKVLRITSLPKLNAKSKQWQSQTTQ